LHRSGKENAFNAILGGFLKYPPGTKIKIKGERHAKSGNIGCVVSKARGAFYQVRLSDGTYQVPGKYIEVLELGPAVVPKKYERENLSKEWSNAYKKVQAKDPKFAGYIERQRWK
jgi:hypothetical protein